MTSFEERSVMFGKTRIAFVLRRSARRRTVSIAIDPVEGVVLTAPTRTPVERIDEVVRDKAPWIVEHERLAAQEEVRPKPRRFVGGESYAYLGRHHRLRIVPCNDPGPPKLKLGRLVVWIPKRLHGQARADAVGERVRGWYEARAHEKLPARVQHWAPRVGVHVPPVLIREQLRRWGSCDGRGVLRLNWRIVQAPVRLVDYVVAHELVHLVHADHTPEFWARLGTAMPDYDKYKDELRRLGPRLEWT